MKLAVASCQFPVSADVSRNARTIVRQMREAKRRGAAVAHFPECALSGYAGVEFESLENFDWAALERAMRAVMAEAKSLGLWVVVGSTHRLTGAHKPHNSLYVIDDRGRLVDRYDKRFCTGKKFKVGSDLKHYSPGDHFVTFTIRGIKCGVLICHDFRYQELYREYLKLGVTLMFHSYHNGHRKADAARARGSVLHEIVPATMQAYAANNYQWISAVNTSRRESDWASFFVRPDGMITGRLTRNRAGVLLSVVDTELVFKNAAGAWRDRAMRGIYHSGKLVSDPRSRNRREL